MAHPMHRKKTSPTHDRAIRGSEKGVRSIKRYRTQSSGRSGCKESSGASSWLNLWLLSSKSRLIPRRGRAGQSRIEFLKKRLEEDGHKCVVLNIRSSRRIPSTEYDWSATAATCCENSGGCYWPRVRGSRAHERGFHQGSYAGLGRRSREPRARPSLLSHLSCWCSSASAVMRSRAWYLTPLYWTLFTIPRRVICNSEAVRQQIQSYGVPARKVVAIPAFSRQYLEFTPAALPSEVEELLQRFSAVVFTYIKDATSVLSTDDDRRHVAGDGATV